MNNNNNAKEKLLLVIVIIGLLFFLGSCFGDSDKNSMRCPNCYKESSDSSNTWSISYSGMCNECYDDFQYTKDMYDYIK